MGILNPFIVCLYCSAVGTWRDPVTHRVTYELQNNATNVLRIGDVVEFTCTASGHSSDVATLEWMRVNGNAEWREIAGRSPLVWTKTITASDHGTSIFCGTAFFDSDPAGSEDWRSYEYYAKSNKIDLQVEGVTAVPSPPNTNGERIWVEVNPVAAQYHVGDTVEYVCHTEGMSFPAIEMRQIKGDLETKHYAGYQTAHRWISQNVTLSDQGTTVACLAWLLDWSWNSYVLYSDHYELNVVA